MNENNKKANIILIVTIGILILLVVGATYAIFKAHLDSGKEASVNITTNTVDKLSFMITNDIVLDNINQDTFVINGGNKNGSSEAIATLNANNKTNKATEYYALSLNITDNDFEYSILEPEPTAELLLTASVTIDDGINEPVTHQITEIEGLNYVTVKGVSGFDVTKAKDKIDIAKIYEIKSTGTTTHRWNVELTFVNLDANQNANAGKKFIASLNIKKEQNLAQYVKALYTTDGEKGLYLHDADLANGAKDGSYRYAGANPNNYVCFGSNENVCPNDNLYRIIGVFDNNVKLIKADYAAANLLGTDGDFSNSFNGPDSSWNLYSSFSSISSSSNSYSMYMNRKKTKNTSFSSYYWNHSNYDAANTELGHYNVWSYSELNKTNLNNNYLVNIGEEWSKKIAETTWYVGGMSEANGYGSNAKTAYDFEVGEKKNITAPFEPYKAKVGLVYVSEYYYAAAPEFWILPGYVGTANCLDDNCLYTNGEDYTKAASDNWMFMGDWEQTISRNSSDSRTAFMVYTDGMISLSSINLDLYVRPVFNLDTVVRYDIGTGSEDDPIRIK